MKVNIYKIISSLAAAGIIIAGCVYLYAGTAVMGTVLPVFCAMLIIMGISNALEAKKAGGGGLPSYIPAICFGVLAAAVAAATVVWYIKKGL